MGILKQNQPTAGHAINFTRRPVNPIKITIILGFLQHCPTPPPKSVPRSLFFNSVPHHHALVHCSFLVGAGLLSSKILLKKSSSYNSSPPFLCTTLRPLEKLQSPHPCLTQLCSSQCGHLPFLGVGPTFRTEITLFHNAIKQRPFLGIMTLCLTFASSRAATFASTVHVHRICDTLCDNNCEREPTSAGFNASPFVAQYCTNSLGGRKLRARKLLISSSGVVIVVPLALHLS